MELTQVKHEIETLAEKYRDEFEAVSAYIFAHPELAYHEMLAQDQLCGLLEKHGFKVQRGAGSLETAFVAEYRSGKPGIPLPLCASTTLFLKLDMHAVTI